MRRGFLFCLAVGVSLFFLTSCRPKADSDAHLVMVDANQTPAASQPQSVQAVSAGDADAGGSGSSSPETAADPSGREGPASGGSAVSRASSGSTSSGRNASAGSAAATEPPAQGDEGDSSPQEGDGAPAMSIPEAVTAVNRAFGINDTLPLVTFRFADSLSGGGSQKGTVTYNNNRSEPVFEQRIRRTGANGGLTDLDYQCDGHTLTCQSFDNGAAHTAETFPYRPAQLPVYVELVTPRLAAANLSDGKVERLGDGGLSFEARDSGSGYGDAVLIAGLSGARVTGAVVRYTVGANGCLTASDQEITIRTGSGERVFRMQKTYIF